MCSFIFAKFVFKRKLELVGNLKLVDKVRSERMSESNGKKAVII